MSFWGVEVKPGKPYTHIHDNIRGPLRLSQVTLGDGEGTKKSVLQCNVGDKRPVLLCSLLPEKSECCGMDLQFEESYEVIFSVVGPRSVHLAGYFVDVGSKRRPGYPSDSDSFGEDIGETESEKSGGHVSEDKYESDFIDDDDDDVGMLYSSRRANGATDEKTLNGHNTPKRSRRKHQISDSDDGEDESQHQTVSRSKKPPASESEDDDFFPISFSLSKKNEEQNLGRRNTLKENVSKGEDKIEAITSDISKKRKKDKVKLLKPLERDDNLPVEKIKDRPREDPRKDGDDKSDEVLSCEREKEELNQEATHSGEQSVKWKKMKNIDEEGALEKSKHVFDHAFEVDLTKNNAKSKKKKKDKVRAEDIPESNHELEVKRKKQDNIKEEHGSVYHENLENSRKLKRKNKRRKEETNTLQKLEKDGDHSSKPMQSTEIGSTSVKVSAPDADNGPIKGKSKRKKGSQ